ncbi:MAG TPA: quinone oxidoreductase [Actinomycetota bacterium]|nr:quinone oxidoreductase [Actinomycetota bacterium]
MRAIVVREHGGPEVLSPEEVADPSPAGGGVVVRLDAAGVNMIDVQQRAGNYAGVQLPFTPGTEGAGEVVEVGSGVEGVARGDRVAFAGVPGAYAELVSAPADRVVPIPDGVPTEVAAAVLLQGMTAHYLSASVCPIDPGDLVVVHSAAGGVGLLLTQLASARGIEVVGTTSSEAKASLIREAGAAEVVIRGRDDLSAVVRERTDGAGARVVFDGVGRDTFDESLACLARRGHLVLFGQSSGGVPPFDVRRLLEAGSVFLTRPGLKHYTATREELTWRADEVLSAVASGALTVHVHGTYPLVDAAEAHRALQGGGTAGKLLLRTSPG